MADAAPDTVLADDTSIRVLGNLFLDWSAEIDKLVPRLDHMAIKPGHVWPTAQDLKERFHARTVDELMTYLQNLSKSLFQMGTELLRMADVYVKAEDLNKDDLKRLDDLIKSVNGIYPGLDTTPPLPDPSTILPSST